MRTLGLALLSFLVGATIAFVIGFPVRFLVVSYTHGGLW